MPISFKRYSFRIARIHEHFLDVLYFTIQLTYLFELFYYLLVFSYEV